MKSWCLALSLGVLLLLLDPSFEAVVSGKTMFLGWALWQYGLWSFKTGYIKLERFLPKNQHTQRKFLNFENWTNGEPQ